MDLRTLRLVRGRGVDATFREWRPDLLFTVKRRGRSPVLVYVHFEHKSTLARLLPLQLLTYVTRILERWARENPGRPLRWVVPVVVYHGAPGIDAVVRLDGLFDQGGEGGSPLLPWMPSYAVPVFDLNRVALETLIEGVGADAPVGAAALALMKSIRSPSVADVLRTLGPTLRSVLRERGGAALLELLISYCIHAATTPPSIEQVIEIMVHDVDAEAEEIVVTLAEKLRREGREEGREEGLALGSRREAAETLLRVLELRFSAVPDRVRARVRDVDHATLRSWLERAVTCDRLDEVF